MYVKLLVQMLYLHTYLRACISHTTTEQKRDKYTKDKPLASGAGSFAETAFII